jgi:two-component system, NtrC family, sensor kinase
MLKIILNAGQSISNEGSIKINTGIEDKFILISVMDTGCGISGENLGKIFDPFFTTKDPGKGTGPGLSITYNIINEHKGYIEVESESGKGTNMKVRLPLAENSLKNS